MAEDSKPKTDYASNSVKSKKAAPAAVDRPEIHQIASASRRKKGIGAKFKESFVGDSAESVAQYVIWDILVPRAKDLLFDIINGGSERALFGTSSPRGRRGSSRRSQLVDKTDYKGMSGSRRERESDREDRELSKKERTNFDFDDIVIPTRGEAEQVRDTLLALVDQYDSATVADFYSAVGISTEHTDLKFGWTDLEEARIEPARGGGYILDLPRVETL